MADLRIALHHETLVLMAERSVFWPRERTLFAADLHVGKAAALRALALPVPEGHVQDDLARLTSAIHRSQAERVVLLGDVLHAKHGRSDSVMRWVAEWRATHARQQFVLVRGNHDLRAGDPPDDWHMVCYDEPAALAPFVLRHEPADSDAGYVLCGHIHPAVQLWGRAGQTQKLVCFVIGARQMVLPAFGSFTSGAVIRPHGTDRIAVIAGDDVIEIERKARR